MNPMMSAWLIVGGFITAALATYWLACRAIERRHPRIAPAGPGPDELLRLRAQLEAPEWLVCDSTECAHMTTPHRRKVAEYAVCTFCGRHAFVPAPKEGTDA